MPETVRFDTCHDVNLLQDLRLCWRKLDKSGTKYKIEEKIQE